MKTRTKNQLTCILILIYLTSFQDKYNELN